MSLANTMNIVLSPIDQERFGVVIAKSNIVPGVDLGALLAWNRVHAVRMLIARCDTSHIALVHEMERESFELMDTLVYFQRNVFGLTRVALPPGLQWRMAEAGDADHVERCALAAFKGYMGHYHADSRLDPADADLVYSSWAASSCRSRGVADAVFLMCQQKRICAFLTLKRHDAEHAEIVLNAVDPSMQGHGLYSALVGLANNWCVEQKVARLLVSTQINNTAPQKVWCRHGFEPSKSIYTFHKWFDDDSV